MQCQFVFVSLGLWVNNSTRLPWQLGLGRFRDNASKWCSCLWKDNGQFHGSNVVGTGLHGWHILHIWINHMIKKKKLRQKPIRSKRRKDKLIMGKKLRKVSWRNRSGMRFLRGSADFEITGGGGGGEERKKKIQFFFFFSLSRKFDSRMH